MSSWLIVVCLWGLGLSIGLWSMLIVVLVGGLMLVVFCIFGLGQGGFLLSLVYWWSVSIVMVMYSGVWMVLIVLVVLL